MKKFISYTRNKILIIFATSFLLLTPFFGCNKSDDSLAPYEGSTNLSAITLEKGSFKPKITWIGGYASVLGVNHGGKAALDTSLIWLVHVSGNNLHYPVKFNELPSGAEDITLQYDGNKVDSLNEDDTYTFWVLKEEVWNQVSAQKGKYLNIDSSLKSTQLNVIDDTVQLSKSDFVNLTLRNDVYVNIKEFQSRGPLGELSFIPIMSNSPIIKWKIIQDGVEDTLVAAIGLAIGSTFDPNNQVWEVYSVIDSAGVNKYGTENVISSPIQLGQQIPGTFVFTQYPDGGLERDKDYLVWIANKNWDHEGRQRFTKYYAYATFKTW